MKLHEISTGDISAKEFTFAIAAARFNSKIVNNLLSGAISTLEKHGVSKDNIDVVYVPGAFELPIIAKNLINQKPYSAVITLGCVIRGDTPHFDFVAGECARGVMDVSLETSIPVIFGVLTTDNEAQAQARSQLDGDNKGIDCALCALEMSNVIQGIRESS